MKRTGDRGPYVIARCTASLLCFAASAAWSAPLEVPRVASAPTLDGFGQDEAWQATEWQEGFCVLGRPGVTATTQTRFRLVHDGFRLYALIEASEPEPTKLRVESSDTRDDVRLWKDDCVQVHLDPGGTGFGYFQFIVTWKGTVMDAVAEDDNRGRGTFALRPEWNADVRAATRLGENCWRAELSIPFAALGLRADITDVWGVNVCRSRYAGAAEHSACSALPPGGGFGQPEHYLRAVLADFDPAPFQWIVSPPETKTVKRGDRLVCQVGTTIQNQTGEFRILNVTAELAGETVVHPLFLKHLEERPITLDLPVTILGEGRLRLSVARRALPGVVLAETVIPVALDYQPLRLKLLQPAYRNCIFASQDIETVRAQITAEAEYAAMPLTVTLSGEGNTSVRRTFEHTGVVRDVEFAAAVLPTGRYTVTASLPDTPAVTCDLRKLPPLAGEVWLDARGNVYVDGEPFLPFGWYSAPFDRAPEMTAVQSYGIWSDVADLHKVLDRARDGGKKLLLTPFHGEKRWDDPIKDEARRGAFTRAHADRVRHVINAIRDHPAILGWYMADEPEGHGHSVEWYKSAYALLREIDPYHPCIMLNYGLRGIRTYYEGCDVLMPDCYPVFRVDGTTRKPLWALTEWTETARALRPTWLVPQVFDWDGTGTITSPGRPPTFDEVRNQIWQVFAAGGGGILMYSYGHDSRTSCALRLGPAYIAREAQACKMALFGQDLRDQMKVETAPADEHFAASLHRSGDDLLLIAVNTAYESRVAQFRLQTPEPAEMLHVVGETRSVTLADGTFADEFAPIATRLYTTSRALADSFDLAGVKGAIAAAEKARLKPGNLIGLGGLPRHRLREIAESPPEGRPVITYSSRHLMYSNRNREWGILYLLDGLTQDVLHHSWAPRGSDSTPWLEVALPKTVPVGRVSVYTPTFEGQAKLRGCRVLLRQPGGTLKSIAEIADNLKHEMVVTFAAEPAEAVRVEMTDFSTRIDGCSETGLITEIEVYTR